MGISVDGSFEIEGNVNFDALKGEITKDKTLRASCICDAVKEEYIESFADESFYLEEQDRFLEILPKHIIDGEVVCRFACVEADDVLTHTVNSHGIVETLEEEGFCE